MANEIKSLDFLVLDEADRMIETGHFAELDNILRLTLRQYQLVFRLRILTVLNDSIAARTSTTLH